MKGRLDVDPERNAATLQRLYDEVMNGHNVDAADELITIDRPDNDPTFPPEFTAGRAGFKKLIAMLIGAFPGLAIARILTRRPCRAPAQDPGDFRPAIPGRPPGPEPPLAWFAA